jgi:hypothetical protein
LLCKGCEITSSDFSAASTPIIHSAIAAATINRAPRRYPKPTFQRDPDAISNRTSKGPANESTDGIEDGNRQCANFERENFAHRQVGGTGGRGGDEENDVKQMSIDLGVRVPLRTESRWRREEVLKARRSHNHWLAPDRVEKFTQYQRADEVAESEWRQMKWKLPGSDLEELFED